MNKQRSKERIKQNNQESKSNERSSSQRREFHQIQQNRQFNVQLAALSNIMKQVDHTYWDRCFSKKQMKEWEQIKSKPSRSPSPQIASIGQIKTKRSDNSKEQIKSNSSIQQKQRSSSLIKPQSQSYGNHYLISKESKTLTDIQPIRRSFQEIPKSQTLQKINVKDDEENIDEMDVEQENYASISQKQIPEFKVGQITMKRSRKRSYDDSENENNCQQDSDYFSYQRDLLLSNKINSKQRSMGDIQNESMKTSLYITQNSFKWSSKLKQFSFTQRKGALQNFYQNSKNQIQQDSSNQIQISTNSKAQNYSKSTSLELNVEQQNISQSLQLLQSAETFSDLSNIYSVQQKSIKDSNSNYYNFKYYCKLDSGSFGQVDLYLLELENKSQIKQEMHINEKLNTGSNNNSDQKDAYYKKSFTYFQSTENEMGDFERQANILELNQNTIQLKKQKSHESAKDDSTRNKLQNSKLIETNNDIQNTLIMNKIRAKAKQLSINKQCNYAQEQIVLPVAGKKINNFNEFVRELYIMQTVQFDMMPQLIGQDIDKRILYIELGLCSLHDLKQDSQKRGYKLDDHFTFSILINIIQAIESMLSNYSDSQQKSQPLFHSDIKPQNIILTIKKNKQTNQSEIKLMLIDFGGASFELEDYWSYYTPAFVCPYLWERLVNSKFKQDFLTWPEVRYAEVYAACRTVQYLMLEERHKELFKKENSQLFIREYEVSYPKTCKILEKVYQSIQDYKIFSDYKNVFNSQDFYSINQRIDFDQEKIFEISKFYQVIQNI
ncbi:hypothetical protein ABPG74_022520 [Tetrahymena malaccensis]